MGQGFIPGMAQMAPASRVALNQRGSRRPLRRRRKKASSPSGSRRRRKGGGKRAAARGRKMKFGTPAWQKKYRVGRYAARRR